MNIKSKLIKKFYQGTCSDRELNLLLDLLGQSTDVSDLKVLNDLWKQMDNPPSIDKAKEKRILANSLAKIKEKEEHSRNGMTQRPKTHIALTSRRNFYLNIAKIAATLLFLVSAWFYFQTASPSMHIIQTAYGEQREIVLPDQSLVILNANSTIKYPQHWQASEDRKVWLLGEAYFEVEKKLQTGQKFQVVTEDLTIEVLGTVFNVNTRKKGTDVFLEEGKVNLNFNGKAENIIMEPGELVSYSQISKRPLVQKIEQEVPSSWKDGTIFFKDTPLKKIIEKMEEIYGVEIIVKEKEGLDRTFTTPLPIDNFEVAFDILKEVTGLTLTKKELPDKQ